MDLFEFFTDKELRIELLEINRRFNDRFIEIREAYDESDDKEHAVQYICEYVVNEIKKYTYKHKNKIINLYDDFDEWYNEQDKGTFENICHHFITSYQINEWIIYTFKNDKEEFKKMDKEIKSSRIERPPQLKRSIKFDETARLKIASEPYKLPPQIRRSIK